MNKKARQNLRMWLLLILISIGSQAEMVGRTDGNSAESATLANPDQSEACRDLKPGESRVVNYETTQSPTGLAARYKLTRTGKMDFTIDLNILMGGVPGEGSARELKSRVAQMKEKVDACFNEFTSTFKDKMGRRIFFHVHVNNPSVAEEIPYNPVNVTVNRIRENHMTLSVHSECGAITHEFMHMLGLCDLYLETENFRPEPSDGFSPVTPSFRCRAVAQNVSRIMANSGNWPQDETRRVLSSAEMNAVLYNGCTKKNKNYYACAKFAYVDPTDGRCPEKPAVCKTDSWLDEVSQ